MKTVLHLASSGSQLWRKSRDGWQAFDGPPDGPVWVVTDLAEESFAEIQIPRIFGRDRQGFIARQLASRFPDTPFRTMLPAKPDGGLMDRIAPPRQTLLGLDAAQRVNSALDALTTPIAGLWAISMLLTLVGCKKALPPNLFVVLPGHDSLRIVFIRNRVPVLSRLIPGARQPQELAAEITRTLRHLENTRVLDRAERRHGVLLLGEAHGMEALLAPDRLDLLPCPSPWATTPPADWRFALFDLALTAPLSQLAPLSRRTSYVATRLRRPAYAVAALTLGLALWASIDNLRNIMANNATLNQMQGSIEKLALQLSEVEQKMTDFGVSADLVRRATMLEEAEIASAPSLPAQMQQLGRVVGQHSAVRLEQLEWRIVPPGQPVCTRGAPIASSDLQQPVMTDPAEPNRLVEISIDVALPQDQSARARTQTIAGLSSLLSRIGGATLIQDPARGLAQASLSGGGASSTTEKTLSWCISLPGQPTRNPAALVTVKP